MSDENTNPFVLPGMGQSGDLAQNPLMASMEMMRQAWQGFARNGGIEQSGMAAPMTLDDLERRIADLRTVENWLRMNLSMLSSSIQGLEVQRATITTLKSFMDTATGTQEAPAGTSPLDAMLGLWPGSPGSAEKSAAPTGSGSTSGKAAKDGGNPQPDKASSNDDTQAAPAQAQAWWDMLKGQFDTLAAATAATMQAAEAAQAASQPSGTGAAKTTAAKSTVKSAKPKAAPAKRAAARKRAPTGAARKKSG